MANFGYLRVSCKGKQDLQNQKYELLNYGQNNHLEIGEFIEVEMSSKRDKDKRRITELFDKLKSGDTLIVAELSRLGRSTVECIDMVNHLIKMNVKFIAIKQNIVVNGKSDLQTKVMVTMFSLFAELERDMISQRTVQALASKKAQGVKLGRPVGALGVSKLDAYRGQIEEFLKHRVAKSAIARMLKISRATLVDYVRSRKLAVG